MRGISSMPNRCARPKIGAVSQTLAQGAGWAGPTPVSHFVNLWETETDCEQPVLLAHRPRAGEAKPLAQPQHGLKPLDRTPRRVEGLKAADPGHVLLDPEVVALDALLQVLGHVMGRHMRQEPVFPGCRDGGWVGTRTIG